MKLLFPEKFIDLNNFSVINSKLSFTNGCFDILHSGHIQSLIFAKSKADKLIVALNSDESIKKLKGSTRPILPLEHRINVLSSLSIVDYVTFFDDLTPINIIKIIKPDVLIKGADYNSENIIGKDFVKEVYLSPLYEDASTSLFLNNYLRNVQNDLI